MGAIEDNDKMFFYIFEWLPFPGKQDFLFAMLATLALVISSKAKTVKEAKSTGILFKLSPLLGSYLANK